MKKVLLPVLFASAGLMLLAGCKDSPAAVVKKYVKAQKEGDANAALSCISDNERMRNNAIGGATMGKQVKALKNAKFSNPIIKDDEATVDMTYEVTQKVHLKKVDGKWKIDDIGRLKVF